MTLNEHLLSNILCTAVQRIFFFFGVIWSCASSSTSIAELFVSCPSSSAESSAEMEVYPPPGVAYLVCLLFFFQLFWRSNFFMRKVGRCRRPVSVELFVSTRVVCWEMGVYPPPGGVSCVCGSLYPPAATRQASITRGELQSAGKGGQEACLQTGANQDGRTPSLTRKLLEEQNWKAACHLKSNGSLTAGLGLPFLPCPSYIIGMVDCVCAVICIEFERTSALVIFKLQWSLTTQKDLCETKYWHGQH